MFMVSSGDETARDGSESDPNIPPAIEILRLAMISRGLCLVAWGGRSWLANPLNFKGSHEARESCFELDYGNHVAGDCGQSHTGMGPK